jgi:hypothetical protein
MEVLFVNLSLNLGAPDSGLGLVSGILAAGCRPQLCQSSMSLDFLSSLNCWNF